MNQNQNDFNINNNNQMNNNQPMNNINSIPVVQQNLNNNEQLNYNNVTDMFPNNNINTFTQNNNQPKKLDKNKKILLIIIPILIVIICICLIVSSNKKEDSNSINKLEEDKKEEQINKEEQKVEKEEITYTTLQKLKSDYDNGIIDVNKYFTELVNYEYNSDKLDKKYKIDKIDYSPSVNNKILELLESHKSELDTNIIKEFIENVTLHNVSLGDATTVKQQFNSDKKYESKLIENKTEDKSNASNHRLDKVTLSRNENFLIWYTDSGSDAITEEQLQQISNGLESSISKFKEIFSIDYSYFPYQDTIFNKDYKNAKEVLKKNGIPIAKINSAMSVYIYDTGSENTLATYTQPYSAYLILDFVVQLGLNDGDGIVTFPYIIINKQGFSTENDSLEQLYNHELFHHFQYLFCRSTSKERCVAGDYVEGTANLASALNYNGNNTDSFLNGYANVYTTNASMKLSDINDTVNYGYGTFPYWYVYSETVNSWAKVLMNAHNEKDPYTYIKNNTSKEDFIKISEKLMYNTLAKKYNNNALYSNDDVKIKENLKSNKKTTNTINAGAIDYYEISGNNTLTAISGNKEYVGIKFYGYKDGSYTELESSMDKIEVDLTYYARYDKFYLAIYNADITNYSTYTIEVKGSDFAENSEFVTTFNNYNIEIDMDITIAGMNTKTISKGVVDELHQKEYLDVTTTSMGLISVNNKIYYDFNSGYSYMTQPYGGDVWWKEKNATQTVDLGAILEKLISMKNVTKVSDNHYKVKMTKEDIKGLIESGNSTTSALNGDVYVEVYTENGYITKLEYDFTELVSGFEKYTTTIKYSNYNQAGDVEIPQSIIDNAKTQ